MGQHAAVAKALVRVRLEDGGDVSGVGACEDERHIPRTAIGSDLNRIRAGDHDVANVLAEPDRIARRVPPEAVPAGIGGRDLIIVDVLSPEAELRWWL